MTNIEEFTPETQRQRIEKGKHQIDLALLESSEELDTSHRVSQVGPVITAKIDDLTFELILDGKYPVQAPRLLLEGEYPYPSISDGRDILPCILDWNSALTLLDILKTLKEKVSDIQQAKAFHLGRPYFTKTWDKGSMKAFPCTEEYPENPRFKKERFLVVTHTMILQLEAHPHYSEIGYLICYSNLPALSAVKRAHSDQSKIILEWKSIGSSPSYAQHFTMSQAEEFINLLVQNMKLAGAQVKKQTRQQLGAIIEDEVNPHSLQKIDINMILQEITQIEQNLYQNLGHQQIDSLIKLYQEAVEYYSAINDPQFDSFLHKMQELMKDEAILTRFGDEAVN